MNQQQQERRDNMSYEDLETHRKRLAQIFRYIASMHQSMAAGDSGGEDGSPLFVARVKVNDLNDGMDLLTNLQERNHNNGSILFSTQDFRQLLTLEESPEFQSALLRPSPFSFYAAAANTKTNQQRKRTLAGTFKETLLNASASAAAAATAAGGGGSADPTKACWLRITRLSQSQVAKPADLDQYRNLPAVREFLRGWAETAIPALGSVDDLLQSLPHFASPPRTVQREGQRQVKVFLRKHKKYLARQTYQNTLEPIYNRLFEWIQQPNDHQTEMVWGLGHARMLLQDDSSEDEENTEQQVIIDGPLLEVLMEVELARDGALLVRPRDHTGVTLNRQIVTALSHTCGPAVLAQLHQTVAELEPCHLSPGQPNTYMPLLKRMAVELSAGGIFQHSAIETSNATDRLIVTEAWCLYARPKPSSVWARDANVLADQLQMRTHLPMELPRATWALTHGPAALDSFENTKATDGAQSSRAFSFSPQKLWDWLNPTATVQPAPESPLTLPLFPLPTSDAQNRIADLLLRQNYPAVVCEGPPGTGKTHSIANLICAYLCQGKRVLVTSKNAPALSVLRHRLPASVRDLCVDVSRSELSGMRQLQLTVERLANRICSVSSDVEAENCRYIQSNLASLDRELSEIDRQLAQRIASASKMVQQNPRLVEVSLCLASEAPWIMKQLSEWTVQQVNELRDRVASLLTSQDDPLHQVQGWNMPISDALLSRVAHQAGRASLSAFRDTATTAWSMIPLLGRGCQDCIAQVEDSLADLRLHGDAPSSPADWAVVWKALQHARAVDLFETQVWQPMERTKNFPHWDFHGTSRLRELHSILEYASEAKELAWSVDAAAAVQAAKEARSQDARRGAIVSRVQQLAEELVDCKVVMELNRSFSSDAQSALIRFAQIAGKVRFSRTSQPSKMTQRQRRRRQEYLQAFDECCRFIPCWILTTSQISDYLPQECLFDLVICDESSQSEVVSVLPGMMRGKQWLIVGDTKQVSPTDCFVAEDQVDSLRASLPPSPFSSSFLPGQSFFDLCAQAFPRGRVVLSEHFRCAEEIIDFSNEQFYDGRLVPLRLPKKSERLNPSIEDVKIDGVKTGKVNVQEADEIVSRIQAFVTSGPAAAKGRTIGVISLIGDEQSRLIRGRLLDSVGPQLMAEHNILVGDPPTFQGAERDIVFLSMVASPGSVPTQSQLMHFQRANVALSRARDRCVLVRSISLNNVPSMGDIKVPIIEFFQKATRQQVGTAGGSNGEEEESTPWERTGKGRAQCLLEKSLVKRGFFIRSMGIVWKNAICVEQQSDDHRAALLVEGAGESLQQWRSSFAQQKAIERVGWKCLRVDAMSLLTDYDKTLESVIEFLAGCGIDEPPIIYDSLDSDKEAEPMPEQAVDQEEEQELKEDDHETEEEMDQEINEEEEESQQQQQHQHQQQQQHQEPNNQGDEPVQPIANAEHNGIDIVVISSDTDDEDDTDRKPAAKVEWDNSIRPDVASSRGALEDAQEEMNASNFGRVVDLAFLRGNGSRAAANQVSGTSRAARPAMHRRLGRSDPFSERKETGNIDKQDGKEESDGDGDDLYHADEESETDEPPRKRQRRHRRFSERNQRDGRWYPGPHRTGSVDEVDTGDWFDTESDIEKGRQSVNEE